MLTAPMLDPMGAVLVEIRGEFIAQGYGDLVRGGEPAPGDEQPAGSYRRFVVLTVVDSPPDPNVPIQRAAIGARCYGTSPHDAALLYGTLVKAVHMVRARLKANGLGIYQSIVVGGGEADFDPANQQPLVHATVQVIATAQAVTS